MPPVILVKSAVRLISTIGVAKVLSDVIKTNTVVQTGVDKVLVNVGGFVLGSLVVEQASNHVNRMMQAVQKEYEENKEQKQPEVVAPKTKAKAS